jgi:hypothetical protein
MIDDEAMIHWEVYGTQHQCPLLETEHSMFWNVHRVITGFRFADRKESGMGCGWDDSGRILIGIDSIWTTEVVDSLSDSEKEVAIQVARKEAVMVHDCLRNTLAKKSTVPRSVLIE